MLTSQLATQGDVHTVWKDACLKQEYFLLFFLLSLELHLQFTL